MGGEGSINGMIISLKNNDLLRRKKVAFKKDRGFFNQSTTSHNSRNKPIKIRQLSEEEKEYYRKKAQAQNRSTFLRSLVIVIALLGIICTILYFGFTRVIG